MVLGIIGGSGLYDIPGFTDARWEAVQSPWGEVSDEILRGKIGAVEIAFLPRHGRGHVISPSEINYRANIDALKRLGVTQIVSVSAVGSLRKRFKPGDFVLVNDFIDRTFAREKSFFGTGCVAHIAFANPTCAHLGEALLRAAKAAEITLHEGATYLAMEGPQFSTQAESRLYRKVWGCDVIGMTNMPEAKLAREAEICYATIAMVTDYDSWHPEHENVSVSAIVATLMKNSKAAKTLVGHIPAALEEGPCPCGCQTALQHALMTDPQKRDPALVAKLDAIASRVL